MTRRRLMAVGSCLWAVMGATVGFSSLANVNGDARALITLACIAFPLCALGGAVSLDRRHDRLAGLLLLISVATPTHFAYAVNLLPLVVGVALLVSPGVILRVRPRDIEAIRCIANRRLRLRGPRRRPRPTLKLVPASLQAGGRSRRAA